MTTDRPVLPGHLNRYRSNTEHVRRSVKFGSGREEIDPSGLHVPRCPIPRRGDHVTWFQEGVPYNGQLLGYTRDDQPYVSAPRRGTRTLGSMDSIRLLDPDRALGPCWERLPPGGALCRPRDEERARIQEFLKRIVPPGIPHDVLVKEITSRGHECFVTGATIRDVLAERSVGEAEFVTTMPPTKLQRVLHSVYGARNACILEGGTVRVGVSDPTDRSAHVRMFRVDEPETGDAIFGGDFETDVQFGDFSCNAVYYEPVNDV